MEQLYTISEVKLSYQPKVKASQRKQITSSFEAYKLFIGSIFLPEIIEYREYLKVLLLNRASKILGVHSVSEGGINGTSADIRIIMQAAILANASGIILCHNHPSGTLIPSKQDDLLTDKIKSAAKLMDLQLLDHLIVTNEGYYSYADKGRLI